MHTLIILGILLFTGKITAFLCEKIKLPSVVGMILLGIILGPSFTGLIESENLTPSDVKETMETHREQNDTIEELSEFFPKQMSFELIRFFSTIGVIILLFMAGLETDIQTFIRAGKSSLFIAIGGIVLPFILGFTLSYTFNPDNFKMAFFTATLLTATSVSISAMSLINLKKVRSQEGNAILSSAIIDDVASIIILSILISSLTGNSKEFYISILLILGYFIIAILSGWLVIPFIMNLSKKMNVSMGITAFALALMFIFAGVAEISRVAGITGAYLAGIFIGRTQLKDTVHQGIETIGQSLFIPLFFIFIGLRVNLLAGEYDWLYIFFFLICAILGKIIGSGISARMNGFSLRQSLTIGSGMVPRGEVALVIVSIGLNYPEVFSNTTLSATVILVIISSFITPILLKKGFGT